jgi:hypothetical protein
MNRPILKASEVEALTFIYAPATDGVPRPWNPRVSSGTVGMALSWALVAGLAWMKVAAVTAPESYGL